jgi:hypothetical protein
MSGYFDNNKSAIAKTVTFIIWFDVELTALYFGGVIKSKSSVKNPGQYL